MTEVASLTNQASLKYFYLAISSEPQGQNPKITAGEYNVGVQGYSGGRKDEVGRCLYLLFESTECRASSTDG
jgi:hypothetical protein